VGREPWCRVPERYVEGEHGQERLVPALCSLLFLKKEDIHVSRKWGGALVDEGG
jgi:hypothetical protein